MNPSTAQAQVIVDELIRNTVSEAVVCAGSRNAPLAYAFHSAAQTGKLRLHIRFDERGAAFLALGLAARTSRPVVVVCTSGTAAANFYPAVLEADRAGVPLIVLTADRPLEMRAAGVSQIIDQQRLYGGAVRYFDELSVAENRPGQNAYWRSQICRAWNAANQQWHRGPVQLNIPLREPLVPDLAQEAENGQEGEPTGWSESLAGRPDGARWTEVSTAVSGPKVLSPSARRGLVLMCAAGPRDIWEWAEEHDWPVISETGGLGLGGSSAIGSGPWLLMAERFVAEHKPEQVLCVGRPTTFRQVDSLLSQRDTEVLLIHPDQYWPAPAQNVRQVGQWFTEPAKPADPDWVAAWRRADSIALAAVEAGLAQERWPNGLQVAADLVDALPPNALLVVGSSNPTRDVAYRGSLRPDVVVHRNRGVSGIDGTVSTAIGAAIGHDGPSYALLGDLTFLHDANAILMAPGEPRPNLTMVVLNDDGGGIFSLLPQAAPEYADSFERLFGTPHGANLEALCVGYRVPYTSVTTRAELKGALKSAPGLRVIEVRVDRHQHFEVRERMKKRVTDALDSLLH